MESLISKIWRKIRSRIFIDYHQDYRSAIFLAGVGRSGTTWVSEIINYNNEYRYVFEPFHPYRVSEVKGFTYHQYIRPQNHDPRLLESAKAVLSGRIRNAWTDAYNKKTFSNKRLIKDIRANLLLKWLHTNFPEMPIILLFRHPCAVANSWIRLGWEKESLGTRTNIETCLCQQELVEDFLKPYKKHIQNAEDDFEKNVFFWCIQNYVPLRQFKHGEIHLAFYENFCEKPRDEISRLFSFLNKPIDEKIFTSLKRPSWLTSRKSAIITGGSLIDGWRKHVSPWQIQRAGEILKLFGLDCIYSQDSMPNVDNAYRMLGRVKQEDECQAKHIG